MKRLQRVSTNLRYCFVSIETFSSNSDVLGDFDRTNARKYHAFIHLEGSYTMKSFNKFRFMRNLLFSRKRGSERERERGVD